MKAYFETLALYNRWANFRLYEAAAALSVADYRADRGAFFKSVHGTLNHVLVGDRIWMHRFTGVGEAPMRLDVIIHDDFPALHIARRAEDERIINYISGLSESALAANFRYRSPAKPDGVEEPLGPTLLHFFNHQTHHRGQAHCLLTGLGVEAPSLDLIVLQRDARLQTPSSAQRT